jgi:hypothetical protein
MRIRILPCTGPARSRLIHSCASAVPSQHPSDFQQLRHWSAGFAALGSPHCGTPAPVRSSSPRPSACSSPSWRRGSSETGRSAGAGDRPRKRACLMSVIAAPPPTRGSGHGRIQAGERFDGDKGDGRHRTSPASSAYCSERVCSIPTRRTIRGGVLVQVPRSHHMSLPIRDHRQRDVGRCGEPVRGRSPPGRILRPGGAHRRRALSKPRSTTRHQRNLSSRLIASPFRSDHRIRQPWEGILTVKVVRAVHEPLRVQGVPESSVPTSV